MAAVNAEQRDAAHAARMKEANPARVSPEQKALIVQIAKAFDVPIELLAGRATARAIRRDRTKIGTTARRGKTAPVEDDLTTPLDPTVRYACEPNPALGRWHVTEITPELLAARKALT